MDKPRQFLIRYLLLCLILFIHIAGCGGDGGSSSSVYKITGKVTLYGNGLEGVIVTLSGTKTVTATTDASGKYIFSDIESGNYTITPSKSGYVFSPVASSQVVNRKSIPLVDFSVVIPWAMQNHDGQRTGRSPFVGAQTASLKWSYATGGHVVTGPVIGADGTVYIGSNDGKTYALDGATGKLKWTFDEMGSLEIGADGTVYVGSSVIYALDGASGSLKWTFDSDFKSYSPFGPTIGPDGTLYVGSDNGKVYALDGVTGEQKWVFQHPYISSSTYNSAISTDGTVYISMSYVGDVPYFYALNSANGHPKWNLHTAGLPSIGPDGTLYLGGGNGGICALNTTSRSIEWSYDIDGQVWNIPAIAADGTVYIGTDSGNFYALDGKTGILKWIFTTAPNPKFYSSSVFSSPAIGADGTVYIGTDSGYLYALDGASGKQRWLFTTGGESFSGPAIGADGTVYVGSTDGKVYAIGK